jgi:hypothetical protein
VFLLGSGRFYNPRETAILPDLFLRLIAVGFDHLPV